MFSEILECCSGNGFDFFFSGYDMIANDGEFDEEDQEGEDMAIPTRYFEEDLFILIIKNRLIILETCEVKCSE